MHETPQPREEPVQPQEVDRAGLASSLTPDTLQLEEQCPEAMEYVSQLIARMNGVGQAPAPVEQNSAGPKPKPRASSQATVKPEPKRVAAAPTIPKTAPTVASPMLCPASEATRPINRSPRNPEITTDLRRLREAANLSATSILEAYELQSTTRKAYTDLMMAVVSMATSMVLVSLSHRVVSVAYGCAVLTFAQAAWSTWSFLRRTDRLRAKPTADGSLCAPEA